MKIAKTLEMRILTASSSRLSPDKAGQPHHVEERAEGGDQDPDDQDDGVPGSGDNPQLIGMDTDDGNESFGFRRLARGQIYGPYHGVEEVSFVNQDNDRTAFIDAFANEIFYYSGHDGFKSDDNDVTPTFDGQTFDIESYAEKPGGNDGYWRSDFLIFSAGADGLIEPFVPGDDTPTDDVTNFLPES